MRPFWQRPSFGDSLLGDNLGLFHSLLGSFFGLGLRLFHSFFGFGSDLLLGSSFFGLGLLSLSLGFDCGLLGGGLSFGDNLLGFLVSSLSLGFHGHGLRLLHNFLDCFGGLLLVSGLNFLADFLGRGFVMGSFGRGVLGG